MRKARDVMAFLTVYNILFYPHRIELLFAEDRRKGAGVRGRVQSESLVTHTILKMVGAKENNFEVGSHKTRAVPGLALEGGLTIEEGTRLGSGSCAVKRGVSRCNVSASPLCLTFLLSFCSSVSSIHTGAISSGKRRRCPNLSTADTLSVSLPASFACDSDMFALPDRRFAACQLLFQTSKA